MEYEVRFYFPSEKFDTIIGKLKNVKDLKMHDKSYEKTTQYDHPDEKNSFYSKEIDGRFRVRVTKNSITSKCKLSWKRRIKSTRDTDVNKDEEVELTIKYEEYDNFMFILDNVLNNSESSNIFSTKLINFIIIFKIILNITNIIKNANNSYNNIFNVE